MTTFATELLVIASWLVAFRLVAIHMGMSAFGEYTLSRRAFSLLSPVVIVGLDVALARYVAYAVTDRSKRSTGYAGAALAVMALTVAVTSAVLLLFSGFFADLFFGSAAYSKLITALPAMLIGSSLHVVAYGFLRGRSQIQRANLLMALNQAAIPVLAAYIGGDVPQILLIMGSAWTVISIGFLATIRPSVKGIRSDGRELLRFGLPRVPGDLLQLALFALPGILVAHLVDLSTAGVVAFGVTALGMVGTSLTPISFVLLPAVAGMYARGSMDQVRLRVLEILRLVVPVLVVGIAVLELFAKPIIADYLGAQFASGADVLRLLMIGALPWGLYVTLKSVIDARYVRPVNARNMAVAFATFVVVAVAGRIFTSSFDWILIAFVAALFVLGGLTLFEVYRIVRQVERGDAQAGGSDSGQATSEGVEVPGREEVSSDPMGRLLRDVEMYVQDTGFFMLPFLSVAVVLLLLGAWATFGHDVLLVTLTILLSIVSITVIVQLDLNRRAQVWNYRQIESLFSVYASLNIAQPLPPMRGWGISPDLANLVISLIHEVKPAVIVEAGSGVSTLIAAYTLKKEGSGLVVSLEQDAGYVEISRANVNRHGLGDFASVRHAPLRKVGIAGKDWLWYDMTKLADIESIDLLVIDGPPGNINRLARYPALPLLADRLSERAVIVLDDCYRHAEREIVARWLSEFPAFTHQVVATEKVTVILRKAGPVAISPMEIEVPFLDVAVPRIQ